MHYISFKQKEASQDATTKMWEIERRKHEAKVTEGEKHNFSTTTGLRGAQSCYRGTCKIQNPGVLTGCSTTTCLGA